jgi:transcriptional regulator with XRE-family HTH domain
MEEQELRHILSTNIKRYRSRRAWSQIKFAEKIEISTNFLSDIETGKGWVSPATLVKIANALEISVFKLFMPESELEQEEKDSMQDMVRRFVQDMSVALDESVNHALQKSIETVSNQYLQEVQ